MTKHDFFFCYNKNLFKFIKDVKGIDYITVAQSPSTKQLFAMFYKTNELQAAIDEYKQVDQIKS